MEGRRENAGDSLFLHFREPGAREVRRMVKQRSERGSAQTKLLLLIP